MRKILTGPGNDCTIGCLLDFTYFEKNYRLIAADLSKQKVLDADSRANYFYWKSNSTHKSYLHSWKIKRNNIRIFQRNNKSFLININGWI